MSAPDTPAGLDGKRSCRLAVVGWPLAAVGGTLLANSDKLVARGDTAGLGFGVGAGCLLAAAAACLIGLGWAARGSTRQLPYMPDPGRGWLYLGMGLNALPIVLTGAVVVLSAVGGSRR